MKKKMTWEEMKKAYPDEWLLITDYELDASYEVVTGIVVQHARDKEGIRRIREIKDGCARYTGEMLVGFKGYMKRCELMGRKPLL